MQGSTDDSSLSHWYYICAMKCNPTLLLLFFISLTSCNNKSTKEASTPLVMKTYVSDSLHLGFDYPENWEVRMNGSRLGIFELLSDSTDQFEENIVTWTEDMPLGISDSLYSKAAVTELKIKNPGLDVHILPAKKLGKNTFYPFEFDFVNSDSTRFFIKGYTLVKGKRGYNFSCTSMSAEASKHASIFETILSSIKPL